MVQLYQSVSLIFEGKITRMDKVKNKNEIAIAMSGGVDSAVAASLLIKNGFRVRGYYMSLKPWNCRERDKPVEQDRAEKIADKLGIQLDILDFQRIFKEEIIGGYISALSQGLTPNPCVMCNRLIKWGSLLEYVQSKGIGLLASGHYAYLQRDENGDVTLHKGLDENKDQSYVLSALPQPVLRHMILPLGNLQKKEVQALAQEFGLSESVDRESQDLCFLSGFKQEDFLRENAKELLESGEITDQDGKVLGRHSGLALYTIGQRKGLGIAWHEPLFVIDKNIERNILIIGTKDKLRQNALTAKDANWISELPQTDDRRYDIKIRYKSKLLKARIHHLQNREFTVIFDESLRDITPGQRVVVYKGRKCLGGGEIVKGMYINNLKR